MAGLAGLGGQSASTGRAKRAAVTAGDGVLMEHALDNCGIGRDGVNRAAAADRACAAVAAIARDERAIDAIAAFATRAAIAAGSRVCGECASGKHETGTIPNRAAQSGNARLAVAAIGRPGVVILAVCTRSAIRPLRIVPCKDAIGRNDRTSIMNRAALRGLASGENQVDQCQRPAGLHVENAAGVVPVKRHRPVRRVQSNLTGNDNRVGDGDRARAGEHDVIGSADRIDKIRGGSTIRKRLLRSEPQRTAPKRQEQKKAWNQLGSGQTTCAHQITKSVVCSGHFGSILH